MQDQQPQSNAAIPEAKTVDPADVVREAQALDLAFAVTLLRVEESLKELP